MRAARNVRIAQCTRSKAQRRCLLETQYPRAHRRSNGVACAQQTLATALDSHEAVRTETQMDAMRLRIDRLSVLLLVPRFFFTHFLRAACGTLWVYALFRVAGATIAIAISRLHLQLTHATLRHVFVLHTLLCVVKVRNKKRKRTKTTSKLPVSSDFRSAQQRRRCSFREWKMATTQLQKRLNCAHSCAAATCSWTQCFDATPMRWAHSHICSPLTILSETVLCYIWPLVYAHSLTIYLVNVVGFFPLFFRFSAAICFRIFRRHLYFRNHCTWPFLSDYIPYLNEANSERNLRRSYFQKYQNFPWNSREILRRRFA